MSESNKMSGDRKADVAIALVVSTAILAAFLSVQGCYNRQDARIQQMVKDGADPIAAVCAVAPSTTIPTICAVAAVKAPK